MVRENDYFERTNYKSQRYVKESIFSLLLKIPKYRLEFYNALPFKEDGTKEEALVDATTYKYLFNGRCNTVAFSNNDKEIIIAGTTDKWAPNIMLTLLFDYHEIQKRSLKNHYSIDSLKFVPPRYYYIYTGDEELKDEYSYAEEFNSKNFDFRVTILKGDNKRNDIIGQYINLIKGIDVVTDEIGHLGCTENHIDIYVNNCINAGILSDFLRKHKAIITDIIYCMISEEYTL